MRALAALALLLVPVFGADAARLPKPKRGFQMKMGQFTVQPGEDLEVCEYRRTPNKKPIDISGFALRMPPGSHHFVVWSYNGPRTDDSTFPQDPVESLGCSGVARDDVIPSVLIPIQTPNARFHLPKGVALRIDPGKQIWLNAHMKNFGTEPVVPDIKFNFYKAKKGTVEHIAEGLIVGNMIDIHVPTGGEQTLTAEWTVPVNLTAVYLATHQHRLGTYANIELNKPTGIERIYESSSWEHPPSLWPNPPLRLAKGDKVRITCRWNNTDDHDVRFGGETTDEMCFILGFFYRDPGDTEKIPFGQCVPTKSGLMCPFAPAVANSNAP